MIKKILKEIKYAYIDCIISPLIWFTTILVILAITLSIHSIFNPTSEFNIKAENYVKSKLGIEIQLKRKPIFEGNISYLIIPEQYKDKELEIKNLIKEYEEIYIKEWNHRVITTQEQVQASIIKLVEANRHGYLGRFETRKYEIDYLGLKSYYIQEARSEILANGGGDRILEPGEKVWAILVSEKYNDTGEIVKQYLR